MALEGSSLHERHPQGFCRRHDTRLGDSSNAKDACAERFHAKPLSRGAAPVFSRARSSLSR